jgi:AraC-like DNA-binding protein
MVLAAGCAALYPAMPLRGHVERYVYVDTPVSPHIVKPLSPRPESGLSFNLNCQDPLRLESARGEVVTHPTAAVFGPLSHRIADIRCNGHYRAFNVLFKGTGYYRLFGIPPAELADRVSDARDVMGRAESIVHEQLCAANSAEAMAEIVDGYLLSKLTGDDLHPIHRVVERLVASEGRANLCELAEHSGLSARQVERKFLEQIGITPKRYARLTRFRHAAHLKAQNPALSWTDVSQAAGFYDHNHLVKDFRELVGATPSDYLRSISTVLETELWCAPGDGQDRPAPVRGEWQPRSSQPTSRLQDVGKLLSTQRHDA